ncbi:glycoside hydrolase family 95 protein [Mucilaginibacter terrigena]|uniref:Glycoside hydrolase family 95 protein n=1 Tax=Mucilaginibacter terrigena TaxID=2492395 RepID=A0A4Q5LRK3_9SPHI|nr:glycoside hydrolase family 95 protein [Mucilaginibacter terrigena]RYU92132.1 glycoside hydrolase family 95 protein [Mucilaginibacter terrigena]
MKRLVLLFWGIVLSIGSFAQNVAVDHRYASVMWYRQPAINWNEALPIGNGRMGAMVYGRVQIEHIQLNEQTLWSGAPRNWNNPDAKKYLPQIRKAALSGRYKQADSIARKMQGPYTESYLPMADLFISYKNIKDSANYTRSLDLDSALSKVQYTSNNITYTRTAFASFPDRVMVMRHAANKPGSISFAAGLSSKLHFKIKVISSNHIMLIGKCPQHVEPVYLWKIKDKEAIQYAKDEKGEGMNFQLDLLIKNEGGTIKIDENGVTVENADAVTFILSAATSYNGFDKSPGLQGKDPAIDAGRYLAAANKLTYAQLKQRHINDYQPIYRRISLNLGESRNKQRPTVERLKLMKEYTDPEIVASIAQFGRYVLIAGSRPGGLPVNLKGIWNDRVRPEYSSNWCIDHDAQMFYYAAETNGLSEMHQPFLDFITDLSKNGRKTAEINYGLPGWCAHHNTDIWRQTGPVGNWGQGNPHWANWNMSGPWLSAHMFDHYLFTGDKVFLRKQAWPVMKGAAEFCLGWLVMGKNGKLASAPSASPENTFITAKGDTAELSVNTTGDIALMRELFSNCIKTATILNVDNAFKNRLISALKKLPPYKIGSKGQLLEWEQEWQPVDPSHRHLTHMYPVFPGNEISPYNNPRLANAAKKALALRAKTNCTWGFVLKAAAWARLGEADSAWTTWQEQLRYVSPLSTSPVNNYGLYPNFFNSDGRDVIMNGNGCATAVMTEMIIQSREGEIELLPALPSIFGAGSIDGVCARGGFEVNIAWKNNKLVQATLYSKLGNSCSLRTVSSIKIYDGNRLVKLNKIGTLYSFKTEKGKRYSIRVI